MRTVCFLISLKHCWWITAELGKSCTVSSPNAAMLLAIKNSIIHENLSRHRRWSMWIFSRNARDIRDIRGICVPAYFPIVRIYLLSLVSFCCLVIMVGYWKCFLFFQEMIEAVREQLVLILHTSEGARVAMSCLCHGTPKVRISTLYNARLRSWKKVYNTILQWYIKTCYKLPRTLQCAGWTPG